MYAMDLCSASDEVLEYQAVQFMSSLSSRYVDRRKEFLLQVRCMSAYLCRPGVRDLVWTSAPYIITDKILVALALGHPQVKNSEAVCKPAETTMNSPQQHGTRIKACGRHVPSSSRIQWSVSHNDIIPHLFHVCLPP